jgi:hypothetical protein
MQAIGYIELQVSGVMRKAPVTCVMKVSNGSDFFKPRVALNVEKIFCPVLNDIPDKWSQNGDSKLYHSWFYCRTLSAVFVLFCFPNPVLCY